MGRKRIKVEKKKKTLKEEVYKYVKTELNETTTSSTSYTSH